MYDDKPRKVLITLAKAVMKDSLWGKDASVPYETAYRKIRLMARPTENVIAQARVRAGWGWVRSWVQSVEIL